MTDPFLDFLKNGLQFHCLHATIIDKIVQANILADKQIAYLFGQTWILCHIILSSTDWKRVGVNDEY